jgi:hypothetical protein
VSQTGKKREEGSLGRFKKRKEVKESPPQKSEKVSKKKQEGKGGEMRSDIWRGRSQRL